MYVLTWRGSSTTLRGLRKSLALNKASRKGATGQNSVQGRKKPVTFVPANCQCVSHVMHYCNFFVISVAALSTLTRHTSGHSPSSWCIKGAFYYNCNAPNSACQLVGRVCGKNDREKHKGRRQCKTKRPVMLLTVMFSNRQHIMCVKRYDSNA